MLITSLGIGYRYSWNKFPRSRRLEEPIISSQRVPIASRKQVANVEQKHGDRQVDAHLVKDVEQFLIPLIRGSIGCGNDGVAHNGKQGRGSSDDVVGGCALISEIQRHQGYAS